MRRAEEQRLQLRLDLRLARAVAGAVRHLQPHPGAHRAAASSGRWSPTPAPATWEVTASTFATLNEMYGNRTVCGIGRGDSAMRVQGRKPNTLARLGDAIARHPRAGRGPGGRRRRHARSGSRGSRTARSCRCGWPAYGPKALELTGPKADGFILQLADPYLTEWMVKAVRAAAAGGRPRPGRADDLRGRARVRRRRPRPRPRAVPLVRRDGRQPRRRPGHPLRRALRRGARGADRLHQGPRGLRLQPPRPRRQPGRPTFVPDEIVDRFCLLGPPRRSSRSWRSCGRWASTSSRSTPCTTRREATIDAYGRSVIPALR